MSRDEVWYSLRRQAANKNCDEKRSGHQSISRRWLDGMDSTNRYISSPLYKAMGCKYNWNLLPFYCGLFVDFVCVDLVVANSVLTSISYSVVSLTDRISFADYKFKGYTYFYLVLKAGDARSWRLKHCSFNFICCFTVSDVYFGDPGLNSVFPSYSTFICSSIYWIRWKLKVRIELFMCRNLQCQIDPVDAVSKCGPKSNWCS